MSRKREQTYQRPGVEQPEVLVRPPNKNRRQKIKEFLWDPKTKTCCTRTPLNWFTITVYYIIFIAITLGIMFLTLSIVRLVAEQNPDAPRLTGEKSLLGSSPGVNFIPFVNSESPFIRTSKSYDSYVRNIEKNLDSCLRDDACKAELKNCGVAPYGYDVGQPCIYLRINKIIRWKPIPFEKDFLPQDFPEDLKKIVAGSEGGKIWVTCQGTEPKDKDRFSKDDFLFQTPPGFNGTGFPYEKTNNYRDPIVAFQLNKKEPDGILHSISCSYWAENLRRNVEILLFFE